MIVITDPTPLGIVFIETATAFLLLSTAIYILGRAIGLPYELKTDRLWKCGEEIDPDDPAREDIEEIPHEVVDLRSRKSL